jgi:hypothetical protein
VEEVVRWNSFPWLQYILQSQEVHACQEVVAYCTDLRKLNDHVCACVCACVCVCLCVDSKSVIRVASQLSSDKDHDMSLPM